MAFLGHIPYNKDTDPGQLFAQGFQNLMGGLGQQSERRKFNMDLANLLSHQQFQQRMGQAGALQQAGMAGGQGYQGPTPQWPAFQGPPQMQSPMGQQAQMGGLMQSQYRQPSVLSPSQQISQNVLRRMNYLIKKREAGTATDNELALLDKMEASQPLVQIGDPFGKEPGGRKFLTEEKRAEVGEAEADKILQPSTTELDKVKDSAVAIIDLTGKKVTGGFLGGGRGTDDFPREALIGAYKQYRVNNNYDGLTNQKRAVFDKIWDQQIANFNNIGYSYPDGTNIGKDEFDWDPKDEEIQQLRKPKEKSPYPEYPDAFLEDGVWKIMKNGQKFRIEE